MLECGLIEDFPGIGKIKIFIESHDKDANGCIRIDVDQIPVFGRLTLGFSTHVTIQPDTISRLESGELTMKDVWDGFWLVLMQSYLKTVKKYGLPVEEILKEGVRYQNWYVSKLN